MPALGSAENGMKFTEERKYYCSHIRKKNSAVFTIWDHLRFTVIDKIMMIK
jgi:hypothetical protein